MMKRARTRVRSDDERGYTLVEMIATVVLMGIVMVPLSGALVQAMQLVPASGTRTQVATDVDRLQSAFSDDVTQAQSASLFMFWSGPVNTVVPTYPKDASQRTTGAPPTTLTPEWNFTNATTFKQAPTAPSYDLAWVTCPSQLAPSIASSGLSVPILTMTWSDGVNADGTPKATPDITVTYKAFFTNAGAGLKLEFHRWIATQGNPESDQGSYASGYCVPGDLVSWPQIMTRDGQQSGIDLLVFFRSSVGAPAYDAYKVSATARPSGTTSP